MQDKRDEELLKQQVLEIMREEEESKKKKSSSASRNSIPAKKKKKKYRGLKTFSILMVSLILLCGMIFGTSFGRKLLYKPASNFVFKHMDNEELIQEFEDTKDNHIDPDDLRTEKYVTNYLIFGIEEFGGAKNTDSMMIATINTKDNVLKLTSLLRDSYVEIPGYKANKLNSAYAKGGARLLVDTIELNYKIKIDGYAWVDFASFEKIVDLLGGVTIELGKEEAEYLNKTNYISKKSNRNVKPGINKLNGNQVMGYCRVRKVKTLGGANNDYGRVVRQQRALQAMFKSYTSSKNIFKLLPITKECLGYVKTNLTQSQIEEAMEAVIENKMTQLETFRIPVDGAFEAPKKYNGVTYPIVLDWDTNRRELYNFIFNTSKKDTTEAAK